jgi:hypothetical protein
VKLSPGASPEIVADRVDVTKNYFVGDRPCNHPRMATDGDIIVWAYGSDYNNNRPNTYVGVMDHMCRSLANPIMVNAKTVSELGPNSGITATDNNVPTDVIDNNDAAAAVVANAKGIFTLGYLSTAGNATEAAYALGISVTQSDVLYSLKRTWIAPIVSPSNIGRPTIATIDANRSLFCASAGNNRPPEKGVACAVLDAATGNQVWKQFVAPTTQDKDGTMHYMSQPTVAKLADGRFALNIVESNGMGRNTNLKGTNLAHLYTSTTARTPSSSTRTRRASPRIRRTRRSAPAPTASTARRTSASSARRRPASAAPRWSWSTSTRTRSSSRGRTIRAAGRSPGTATPGTSPTGTAATRCARAVTSCAASATFRTPAITSTAAT